MALDYRYPKYDLDQSIEVARRISDRGTGATVSGPELAAMLAYSGTNNGAYLNRLAAARMFSLIDGQADAIRVTDSAERILHPDYPETEARARIDAFRSVPLYDAFLEAFRGRELPDAKGMANVLMSRFKVPEAEAGKVVGRLLLSAEQAGLFKVGGPNRMIVPTLSQPSAEPTPVATDLGMSWAVTESATRRFPKIIDGALDLMPANPPWAEDEYREWLSFFDQACRVYYRIKRAGSVAIDE